MAREVTVAATQMRCGADRARNVERAEALVREAAGRSFSFATRPLASATGTESNRTSIGNMPLRGSDAPAISTRDPGMA